MVQVFTILFFAGLFLLSFNFFLGLQNITISSRFLVRVIGYLFMAVSSVFFALINSQWFMSSEGYTCAVAVSWMMPILFEKLLQGIWFMYKYYH